ncbi:MAG: glycosyltransferase family 2 protein [Bacteroidales bacterium]
MAAKIILGISILAILHSYLLFPLILELIGRLRRRKPEPRLAQPELPFVTILLSAYNEEAVIGEKIASIYDTTYPPDRFEVLIGSDASTDRTVEIVENLAREHPTLHFFPSDHRRGKPNVINSLVEKARGGILILTDANVIFEPATLSQLLAPFDDRAVGLVDTRMINLGIKREGISHQEKAYISREVRIKHLESRLWGSMMGPFGGCFAIRKELFEPVPPNFLVDDFYLNMKVLESGYQAINNPEACVYEDVSNDLGIEFRRKIRISTGNFQNLVRFRKLLLPSRPGIAFCFWSHKVLRWFGPLFLIAIGFTLAWLSSTSVFWLVLLAGYLGLLAVPVADLLLKKLNLHFILFRFITHFLAMNLALLIGFFRYLKGVKTNVWQPTKRHQ